MTTSITRTVLCAALAAFAMTSGDNAAYAAAPTAGYQTSIWENNTQMCLTGQYRWGNGPWQSFRVESGRSTAVWRSDALYRVPLQIRFDADPGPGFMTRCYTLKTWWNPTTVFNSGPTEVFVILADGTIDLQYVRQ